MKKILLFTILAAFSAVAYGQIDITKRKVKCDTLILKTNVDTVWSLRMNDAADTLWLNDVPFVGGSELNDTGYYDRVLNYSGDTISQIQIDNLLESAIDGAAFVFDREQGDHIFSGVADLTALGFRESAMMIFYNSDLGREIFMKIDTVSATMSYQESEYKTRIQLQIDANSLDFTKKQYGQTAENIMTVDTSALMTGLDSIRLHGGLYCGTDVEAGNSLKGGRLMLYYDPADSAIIAVTADTVYFKSNNPVKIESDLVVEGDIDLGNEQTLQSGVKDLVTTDTIASAGAYLGCIFVNKIVQAQMSGALTDGTPTDAEIDAATGTTPAAVGAGWKRTIKDTNGTGLLYIVESDGTNWFYSVMAKAL